MLILLYGRAMGGSVPFEDALAARLALFRPSVQTLAKFLDTRPPRYVISDQIYNCIFNLNY